jgi:hypothetical protein
MGDLSPLELPPLTTFSQRALDLMGQIAYGQEVRVILTDRAEAPVTVAMASRTVLLHPRRADYYDLLLGARLLRRRREAERLQRERGEIPPWMVRRWLRLDARRLAAELPGVARLPGLLRAGAAGHATGVLRVVWERVPWRPLHSEELEAVGPGELRMIEVPGLSFGDGGDLAAVWESIRSGRFPLEHLPELREMPVATVPLNLRFSPAYGPDFERLEGDLNAEPQLQRTLMNCYRRKSEGKDEVTFGAAHDYWGYRLDPGRAVPAVLGSRSGRPVRLFRRRRDEFHSQFNPREHLVVYGVDLNALHPNGYGRPRWSARGTAITCRVFERLGVDFALVGFADRLVPLPDGGAVYLHLPVCLKQAREPFAGAFFSRLAHVVSRPPDLPGEPAAFAPLQVRTLDRHMTEVVRRVDHAYTTLMYVAPHGLPDHRPALHAPEFLSRAANKVDELLRSLERRLEDRRTDFGFFYVSPELKLHGKPHGHVARMNTL